MLVGRATWNYKAYENDASGSVHNPTYIMAGLKKAEQEALSVGGKFTLRGRQHVGQEEQERPCGRASSSTATAPPRPARQGHAHAWHHRARQPPLSDATGHFAFTFKVTKTYKNYKVKWVRSSSAATGPPQQGHSPIKVDEVT